MRKAHLGLLFLVIFFCSAACSVGYGIKVGYQKKMIRHTGYTAAEIFGASREALQTVGIVRSENKETGIITGEIPPYHVTATITEDSPWLKLEGRENERGLWKRDKTKDEWFLSIDGTLYYRVGAETIKDALRKWSHEINRRIPAR